MAWNPTVEPQDYIILAGERSPGVAEVSGADTKLKWDKRRGYGLSYGTSIFRGVELAEPTVTLRLYSQQDWNDWDTFRPLVARPPQGQRPRAMDISHPFFESAGIRSVTIQEVGQPKEAADGEYVITIKMLEFNRSVFSLARPTASEERPLTERQRQIQALTGQLSTLRSGTTP